MMSRVDTTNIEDALRDAFVVQVPPSARAAIDARMNAAIADEATISSRILRPRTSARWILAAAAAALLVTGTVAGASTLLNRLASGSSMLDHVWDDSSPIGKSVSDAGYTVTVERAAYAPGISNMRPAGDQRDFFWVALTTKSDPGQSVGFGNMTLRDSAGNQLTGAISAALADPETLATISGFPVPIGTHLVGPYTLTITSVQPVEGVDHRKIEGHWVFEFALPAVR